MLPTFAWAGSKADAAAEANRAVRDVLQTESEPNLDHVDRRRDLQSPLEAAPDHRPIRWQAGYVNLRKQWQEFEEVKDAAADNNRLVEYRWRRAASQPTYSDQVKLARWCQKQQLFDQERAHLVTALRKSTPTDSRDQVYERLGYRRVGRDWVSPEDISEVHRTVREQQAGFDKWLSRVKPLFDKLGGSDKSRREALESLREIKDPSAAAVIDRMLGWGNSETAFSAVEILDQLRGYEASRALASQSLFSPWKSVRDRATVALKSRRKEEFVPELVSLLHTPVRSEVQVFGRSRWATYVNYLWGRESQDQYEVARLGVAYSPLESTGRFDPRGRNYYANLSNHAAYVARRVHEEQVLQDLLMTRERYVEQLNELTSSVNQRVGIIMAAISGEESSDDPQKWWSWWSNFMGFECLCEKRTVIVDEQRVWTTPPNPLPSCLVAGTPIWTDHGFAAIEQIRVGDRVLAKNIETGELAFKPVLHTTVRPPSPTFVFTVGEDSITSSVGHNWWVSGAGWTKTRELHDGQPLHTATGMTRVSHVETAAEEKTYNLVVADFHTYFVGHTHMLSHDVLPPRPTNKLVPGLVDE
ncbi:MAG: hypothetical protein HZA46_06165 [Planctomycetales bacterium]|nr:hypothetical protein [Planctomycetales bacterium]